MSVRTTCPYCGVGCGVLIDRADDGRVAVRGDPDHPANHGRLCSKGAALAETLGLEERLLHPEVQGRRATWDVALGLVAGRFREVVDRHGPDAVAFYVSGQLLTEDYYVANKLMKGFIGGANIDTNSRLCMASSVAGHRRAFGADVVPGCYEDLEAAELVVFAGSNAAWCHPVLYQRVAGAKQANPRMRVVVIDPRRTATCEIADLHLALAPGTDVWLWNGLLAHLFRHGAVDFEFLERRTEGWSEALAAARDSAPSIPAAARACGLVEEDVARFFHWFAQTERTVTLYSQGVNQSSSGTDKVNAILNCHLATGRVGRPGMGPFSLTGQPNAMGGREVGGLSNQLAAHMALESAADRARVQRFWRAPRMAEQPGLKAVDLFRAVEKGRVKALWIMATNPAVSLPDAKQVRRALAACEFLVVSDCMNNTDTVRYAHVRLPALAWGEKEGTVTNSERRLSRSRAFLPAPGQARADWWMIAQVGRRLGFGEAFDYRSPAEVFREHAALSGFENEGTRAFDISGLAGVTDEAYENLEPVQWPVTRDTRAGQPRLFGDGRFLTPSGRARFVALAPRPPAHAPDRDYPLALNTGRVRDHWHTLTRTAKSPRLSAHTVEPQAELHPADAGALGVRDGELVRVTSRWGEAIARARVTETQRPGSAFLPMHWNEAYASHGIAGAAVNPDVDPISGQPELKHTPARVAPYRPKWHGFALTRRPLDTTRCTYHVRALGRGFWRYEIAGETEPTDWAAWARDWLGSDGEWLDYHDRAGRRYRAACLRGDRLEACLFVAPDARLPERDWLAGLFARERLTGAERASLLAARAPRGQPDQGKTVCACFGVGEKTLLDAIGARGLATVAEIGAHLKAGTNCGSCVPELAALLLRAGGAKKIA